MGALSLFSDLYLSCMSICTFSSFHFRKQLSIETGGKKRNRQRVVMSCTHAKMPRRGVWQNPQVARKCSHLVSLGLILLPVPFILQPCPLAGGKWEAFPSQWARVRKGAEVGRPMVFMG